jgi:hypothetical protein
MPYSEDDLEHQCDQLTEAILAERDEHARDTLVWELDRKQEELLERRKAELQQSQAAGQTAE